MVWVVFVRESTALKVHVTCSAGCRFIVAVSAAALPTLSASEQLTSVNPNPVGRLTVTE
jgi:hypothetical protein